MYFIYIKINKYVNNQQVSTNVCLFYLSLHQFVLFPNFFHTNFCYFSLPKQTSTPLVFLIALSLCNAYMFKYFYLSGCVSVLSKRAAPSLTLFCHYTSALAATTFFLHGSTTFFSIAYFLRLANVCVRLNVREQLCRSLSLSLPQSRSQFICLCVCFVRSHY